MNQHLPSTTSFKRFSPAAAYALGLVGFAIVASTCNVQGQLISVPNGSFESPVTAPPASPFIDTWQKTAQPVWFDPNDFGGLTWDQTSGLFPNPGVGEPGRIDNIDGNQAAYLFTLPEVGLTQTLTDTFQAGLSYDLTVSVFGTGPIVDGAVLQIGLFYVNGGNPVSLASSLITYTAAGFPVANHFYDFSVNLPAVQSGNAWAGQSIGIELRSLNNNGGGGYWDLDNVRLTAVPEPSTYALLAAGAGGWLLLRRRRGSRK